MAEYEREEVAAGVDLQVGVGREREICGRAAELGGDGFFPVACCVGERRVVVDVPRGNAGDCEREDDANSAVCKYEKGMDGRRERTRSTWQRAARR